MALFAFYSTYAAVAAIVARMSSTSSCCCGFVGYELVPLASRLLLQLTGQNAAVGCASVVSATVPRMSIKPSADLICPVPYGILPLVEAGTRKCS